jgi:hypothetical protein
MTANCVQGCCPQYAHLSLFAQLSEDFDSDEEEEDENDGEGTYGVSAKKIQKPHAYA